MAGRKPSDPTAEIKGVLKFHGVTYQAIANKVGESEETVTRKMGIDGFATFVYGTAFKDILAEITRRGQAVG